MLNYRASGQAYRWHRRNPDELPQTPQLRVVTKINQYIRPRIARITSESARCVVSAGVKLISWLTMVDVIIRKVPDNPSQIAIAL